MNANKTQTRKSPRSLLGAMLALTVAAAIWPSVSRADDKRTERAVPRQVAMSQSTSKASAPVDARAEEQAFKVVRRNVSLLQACYLRAGGGGGKLQVSFEVGPRGRATDIQVTGAALQGTSIPDCVSTAVARWPFPTSARARVSFPLLFVQS
jgi:hypothetical protein